MNPPSPKLILAHLRPQPAIPAVFVLLLTWVLARMTMSQPEPGMLLIWLVLAWSGPLTAPNPKIPALPVAMWIATAVAVAGLAIQAWRVSTGRFKPTIEVDQDTA